MLAAATVIVQSTSPSSASSFCPVSVTSCGVLHRVAAVAAVNVSVFDAAGVALPAVDTRHSPASLLVTVTVTSAVGSLASATLNAAVPPPSVTVSRGFIDAASSDSTSAASSSSVLRAVNIRSGTSVSLL